MKKIAEWVSEVISDRRVPPRVRVYRWVVRPAIGLEEVAKMKRQKVVTEEDAKIS